MALQYRTIRAATSGLLIAVAMGAGGMTGMTSALATNPPADVAFDATVTVNLPPSTHAGVALAGAVVQLDARRAGGEPFQTGAPDAARATSWKTTAGASVATDVLGVRATAPDRLGPALTTGFLIGLIVSALLFTPRPGSRRRG